MSASAICWNRIIFCNLSLWALEWHGTTCAKGRKWTAKNRHQPYLCGQNHQQQQEGVNRVNFVNPLYSVYTVYNKINLWNGYKYQLEPCDVIKTRYECPGCHHKTFVRYVFTGTHTPIADAVGKCNRVDKCGYHYTPREYFHDTDDKFGSEETAEAVELYKIGTSKKWNGATIFWQLNDSGNCRTGKIMLYDRMTGHRVKTGYPHITWFTNRNSLKISTSPSVCSVLTW